MPSSVWRAAAWRAVLSWGSPSAPVIVAVVALASACSQRDVPRAFYQEVASPGHIVRDIDALERIRWSMPQSCIRDGECPAGSHCDDHTGTCAWECINDEQCGANHACNDVGTCVARFQPLAAAGPSCAIDRDQLLALNASTPAVTCTDDANCPCGSYCDQLNGGVCHVDCLTDSPPTGYTCGTGQSCTPLGKCQAPGAGTPPVLALHIAPGDADGDGTPDPQITADTTAASVRVPVSVSIEVGIATTVAAAQAAAQSATVRYGFRGIDDPSLPPDPTVPRPDPSTLPKVACATGAAGASHCDLAGGWTFTGAAVVSATRTIYVDIPQRATAQTWTLEATSALAPIPGSDAVQALPAPTTGHYKGIVAWKPADVASSALPLALPVDVYRTASAIAIVEPSGALIPDGKVEIATATTKATLVSWLTGGGGSYQAALVDPIGTPFPTDRHVTRSFDVRFGQRRAGSLALDVRLAGDDGVPACGAGLPACAQGSTCAATVGLCLPGPAASYTITDITAPPGGGQVLSSDLIHAWAPAVDALVTANPGGLGGTPAERLERAYCAAPTPGSAAMKLDPSTTLAPSNDFGCTNRIAPAQPTFGFVNQPAEVTHDGNATFELLEACRTDLQVMPDKDAATLLASAPCVSLARFFLAMRAHASADGTSASEPVDVTQRLIMQVLRQWLNLTTYVAETTIKDRDYDDVVGTSGDAAQTRFATALDQVEANLRVLLDPAVRPQLLGSGAATSLTFPDYRVPLRPVARWTFNQGVNPAPDVEGHNPLSIGSAIPVSPHDLPFTGPPTGDRAVHATNAVTVRSAKNYSFAGLVQFVPYATPRRLFAVTLGSVTLLSLDGSTTDSGLTVTLTLSGVGGTTTFVAPWGRVLEGKSAFIAIVAEPGHYRAYVDGTAAPATSAQEPVWPTGTGVFALGTSLAAAATCTQWDLYVPGDGLNSFTVSHSSEAGVAQTNDAFANEPSQSDLDGMCQFKDGSPRRGQLITQMSQQAPNPSQAALNALVVKSTAFDCHVRSVFHRDTQQFTWTAACECHREIDFPSADTARRQVCGTATDLVFGRWDEVSIWDRAVTQDEFNTMRARYVDNTSESLPAPQNLGGEQSVALPVHMVEAASAELDLVAGYLDAEQAVIYPDCSLGRPSSELATALARAGRNVRLALTIANEAAQYAALAASTASWRARYDSSLQAFLAKQATVMNAIANAQTCRNPLGLSEEDIPLYVGTPDGNTAIEKFFASTRFLMRTTLGDQPAGVFSGVNGAARDDKAAAVTAYDIVRTEAFQKQQGSDTKTQRLAELHISYEAQLVKLCGPRGTSVLDGFLNGTIDASNCYLTSASCSSQTAIADQPASCLNGEIGEQILAVQTALVDASTARATAKNAADAYGVQVAYCARLQAGADGDLKAFDAHIAALQALQAEADENSLFGDVVKGLGGIAAGAFTGGFAGGLIAGLLGEINLIQQADAQDIQFKITQENAAYQRAQIERHGADVVMNCYNTADHERLAANDATSKIVQASARITAAQLALSNAANAIAGIVQNATSDISLENAITVTPPQRHYWLADDIVRYRTQFALARRLAFLTVQSYENETQTKDRASRAAVLRARNPFDLAAALQPIWGHIQPTSHDPAIGDTTDNGNPVVLSMRTQILHLQDLAVGSGKDDKELLHEYFASDDSKMYDSAGNYRGRAIRFTLGPASWNTNYCAERLWRIVPAVTFSGDPVASTGVKIYHRNTFASQTCGGTPRTLTGTRLRVNDDLLVGSSSAPSFKAPEDYLIFATDGPPNAADLKSLPPGPASALSGRGPYGEYILLFPACNKCSDADGYTDNVMQNLVTDIQLRIDFLYETNP